MEENSIVEEDRCVRDNKKSRIVGESGRLWESELREVDYRVWKIVGETRHCRTKGIMGEKDLHKRQETVGETRDYGKGRKIVGQKWNYVNKGIIEEKGELWEKRDDEKNRALWERQRSWQ